MKELAKILQKYIALGMLPKDVSDTIEVALQQIAAHLSDTDVVLTKTELSKRRLMLYDLVLTFFGMNEIQFLGLTPKFSPSGAWSTIESDIQTDTGDCCDCRHRECYYKFNDTSYYKCEHMERCRRPKVLRHHALATLGEWLCRNDDVLLSAIGDDEKYLNYMVRNLNKRKFGLGKSLYTLLQTNLIKELQTKNLRFRRLCNLLTQNHC